MWKGVIVAYVVIAACYLPVALVGYWAFGNDVDENILITLNRSRWLIAAANMMVVVHVVGSYQVYAMSVFDMIETMLVRKYWFTPGFSSVSLPGLSTLHSQCSWPSHSPSSASCSVSSVDSPTHPRATSFPASCGSSSTSPEGSASHGLPTG
uniref:Amino acid transporter transmembrane domain-containing protein n=2 Tax=Zea mays TaxID=4577 RepID=A0A804QE09_MAIZE